MRLFSLFLISIIVLSAISSASAIEEILDGFNAKYGTHDTRLDTCDLCHIADKPLRNTCHSCHTPGKPETSDKPETHGNLMTADINLNPYGMKLKENLNMEMGQAFQKLENGDPDNDGFTTIEEIRELKSPGDNKDKPPKKSASIAKLFDFDRFINLIFK